ncbi:MAG: 4Fe-4S binding protein [Firmicutes bacterium]|nr:4Fe-4S binding protein [Bacillota bacterium]
MDEREGPSADPSRCLGCGLCVTGCPSGVRDLAPPAGPGRRLTGPPAPRRRRPVRGRRTSRPPSCRRPPPS